MRELWKADTNRWEVRAVQGESHPERDSEGETIYSNTHFQAPGEAWDRLLANADAGVKMGARAVESARLSLREAEQHAAQDAVNYAAATAGREAYLRKVQSAAQS